MDFFVRAVRGRLAGAVAVFAALLVFLLLVSAHEGSRFFSNEVIIEPIAIRCPGTFSVRPWPPERVTVETNGVTYEETSVLIADEGRGIVLRFGLYEGVTYDAALVYSEAVAKTSKWDVLSEEERQSCEARSLSAEGFSTVGYGNPDEMTIDGHPAFIQTGSWLSEERVEIVFQCIEVDEDSVGIVYCSIPEKDYLKNKVMLEKIFASMVVLQ